MRQIVYTSLRCIMRHIDELIRDIRDGTFDAQLTLLYGGDFFEQRNRYLHLLFTFSKRVPECTKVALISSPCKVDLLGGYEARQSDKAVTMAANVDCIGIAAKLPARNVLFRSLGFPMMNMNLDGFLRRRQEAHSPRAIIRGIYSRFNYLGYNVGGMALFTHSGITSGAGLSSSTSVSVLMAMAMNVLYNDSSISTDELYRITHWVENNCFMKS